MTAHNCVLGDGWFILSDEACRLVVTTKELRDELLHHEGRFVKGGHVREFAHKRIGPGVYELTIAPMKETR